MDIGQEQLRGFSAIDNSTAADLVVVPGADWAIASDGAPDEIKKISISVKGDTLRVRRSRYKRILPLRDIVLHVRLPELKGLNTSGSGEIQVDGEFGANNFSAEVSGSGYVSANGRIGALELRTSGSGGISFEGTSDSAKVRTSGGGGVDLLLETGSLTVNISGSGNVTIQGTADDGTYKLSGSGGISAHELTVQKAEVTISGSGGAAMRIEDTLSATLSGSGSLTYYGDPEIIKSKATGRGRVTREE